MDDIPHGPDARPGLCYTPGMERAEAIARLKAHEAEFRQLGVQHLYLFGSTARSDAREDSDVELFFDHERGKLSLFKLMVEHARTPRLHDIVETIDRSHSQTDGITRETFEAS